MNLRQAAHQALEALERGETKLRWAAITALRAALAEPEQEPVAWEQFYPDIGNPQTTHWEGCEAVHPECRKPEQEPMATKQMLRWVEHLKRLSDDGQHMSIPGLSSGACWELAIDLEQFIKNTAPTPRKPLTDAEIQSIWAKTFEMGSSANTFARAIERAHGIGEQHE